MTQSETAEGSELGALAHALAAHARRRGALGRRSVAALPAAVRPAASPSPARAQAPAPQSPPLQSPPLRQPASQPPAAKPPEKESSPAAPAAAAYVPTRAPASQAPTATPEPGDSGPSPAQLAPAAATLEELAAGVAACTACPLAKTRTQTVFADGTCSSGVLFVGEGPGAEEDRAGVPFVGRAGQLLTDIVTKGMGLAREEVGIVNVVKCRPPENRDPTPEEKAACAPWLDRQLELFDPKVIVPLGRHAATTILGVDAPLGRLRARVHGARGRKVVPTYHPAYLLRAPQEKKKTWEDIQLAMREAGIALPGSK